VGFESSFSKMIRASGMSTIVGGTFFEEGCDSLDTLGVLAGVRDLGALRLGLFLERGMERLVEQAFRASQNLDGHGSEAFGELFGVAVELTRRDDFVDESQLRGPFHRDAFVEERH